MQRILEVYELKRTPCFRTALEASLGKSLFPCMNTAIELLPFRVRGRRAVEHRSELDMLSLLSVHACIGLQLNADTLASGLFCDKGQNGGL